MEVEDTIANVTLSTTPSLITRQRQNLGRIPLARPGAGRSSCTPSRAGTLTGAVTLIGATVRAFATDQALGGKAPAAGAAPGGGRWGRAARRPSASPLRLRRAGVGRQFEDDLNALTLEDALQVDLFAGYELGRGVTLFASAENLFDAEIVAARTPVPSLAPPRLVRAGVRVRAF